MDELMSKTVEPLMTATYDKAEDEADLRCV